ncbi:uncharacterized protein BDW43DRAFT_266871 [Aspergillus alliaceus]|uniref:uncharacterized protein n=1 Tax=Petromyces alliaceus TaxID=209559 RepID=UPI0012A525F5|nr:uncharacterized protein BDW43DRAFT_266871 [Aspergillus alliaceus]KAB8236402.1 hypothetical protein BDW43DRAFT_266871 [Aspergillus alliaceus]
MDFPSCNDAATARTSTLPSERALSKRPVVFMTRLPPVKTSPWKVKPTWDISVFRILVKVLL